MCSNCFKRHVWNWKLHILWNERLNLKVFNFEKIILLDDVACNLVMFVLVSNSTNSDHDEPSSSTVFQSKFFFKSNSILIHI